MATVRNFSRHPFNPDQVRALADAFPGTDPGAPETPLFKDARDFGSRVSGETASAAVPVEILLDALSSGLLGDGTVLIIWAADPAARKRARFATRGIAAYRLADGRWQKIVDIGLEPTVEVGFQDGKEVPYGTPPAT